MTTAQSAILWSKYMNPEFIQIGLLSAAGCILLIKTILFLRIEDRKNALSWIHFNLHEIYTSPGREIQTAKKRQNTLTNITFLLCLASLFFYFLTK